MKFSRRLKKKRAALCAFLGSALLLCPATRILAAESDKAIEYNFDQIVVTATRSQRNVKDVPASVTVITADEIKKMDVTSIDQVLIRSAGIYVSRLRGMANPTTGVAMRGFSGASQTLVLMDGVPLNDSYSGVVRWSSIPVDSVERIEIVKGPGSTLYGSQAMAGVINIITKSPEKSETILTSKWSNYNTWDNQLSHSSKISDKLSFRFDYEKKSTDGYVNDFKTVTSSSGTGTTGVVGYSATSTNKGVRTYLVGDVGRAIWNEDNIGGKITYKFDAKKSLTLSILHNAYTYTYGAYNNYLSLNGAPFTGTASIGGGQRITVSNATFYSQPGGLETNRYAANYKDEGNGWTITAGFADTPQNYNITNSSVAGSGRVQEKPLSRYNLDVLKELKFGDRNQTVVGFHYGKDQMQMHEYYLSNWQDFGSKTGLYSQAAGSAKSWAMFAQNEHKFNDRWSLTLGVRYDQWNTEGMVQPNTQSAQNCPEHGESAVSPKVAIQYNTDKSSNLYLSWGKAFQAPDLYRIYSSSITSTTPPQWNDPNPELRPQKVSTIELGWKKGMGKNTNLNLALFHNDVSDLIYQRSLGSVVRNGITYNLTRYENAGASIANGIEMELGHRFSPIWSGFLNYTWQRSIITSNETNRSLEGKLVTGLPEHLLRLGIDYQHDRWHALLTGNFASKRYSSDDNSDTTNGVPGSYDPYFVVNLSFDYKVDPRTTLSFGIENLLNTVYYNYYLAPGRTCFVQASYKF